MMDLCLDEIYTIIKKEKVGLMADVVVQVVSIMDIKPTFTHREIALKMLQDERFSLYKLQICSLAGTDPLALLKEQLSNIE
jgi:hypothetical protein